MRQSDVPIALSSCPSSMKAGVIVKESKLVDHVEGLWGHTTEPVQTN